MEYICQKNMGRKPTWKGDNKNFIYIRLAIVPGIDQVVLSSTQSIESREGLLC